MVSRRDNLILWTGRKHSGKTTAAGRLARQVRSKGFSVAGLLAPAVYKDGRLVGFGAVDLRREKRVTLASQKVNGGKTGRLGPAADKKGGWRPLVFTKAGAKLGKAALSLSAARSAELVIVDEFGPLELAGEGWRKNVDQLLASTDALVVLVVREELAEQVQELYKNYPSLKLEAAEQRSIDEVIGRLSLRRSVKERVFRKPYVAFEGSEQNAQT